MHSGSETKSRSLSKILLAVLTAIFVTVPAVVYNVQAAIAEPSPETLGTLISGPDDLSGAGERGVWLAMYFPKVNEVDVFGVSGQIKEPGNLVCDPASEWWCREGTE